MSFNQRHMYHISNQLQMLLQPPMRGPGAISVDDLAKGVRDLSRWFTTEREMRPASYLDHPSLAAAYTAYFMPVNLAKIQVLLDELHDAQGIDLDPGASFSMLDVGSGPGTGALAVLDWLATADRMPAHLQIISVDQSKASNQSAVSLFQRYCSEARIEKADLRPGAGDLQRGVQSIGWKPAREGAPYDLIVMANSLNELFVGSEDVLAKRAELIDELLKMLKPHGTLMILEPALREVARELHGVRDLLLQRKRCTIFSPCLHEISCPALVRRDDWCHEERPWHPPAMVQAIDQEVGFIKDALKFSYLLLRTDGKQVVARSPTIFRVVSELRVLKGEKRAWLCNELGRTEIGRLDRMQAPANQDFDRCGRGAIISIDSIIKKQEGGSGLGRIPKEGAVRIVRAVSPDQSASGSELPC
ncbi:MAG: small ribosomal subunit Rsm22 family protein [Nitrospira sp.]